MIHRLKAILYSGSLGKAMEIAALEAVVNNSLVIQIFRYKQGERFLFPSRRKQLVSFLLFDLASGINLLTKSQLLVAG